VLYEMKAAVRFTRWIGPLWELNPDADGSASARARRIGIDPRQALGPTLLRVSAGIEFVGAY
jgi:hypothetical protein